MSAKALLALQRIDSEGDALRAERAGLAERAALSENEAALARLADERAALGERVAACTREERRLESEIAGLREQASEVETTLYSGSVRAVSELEGLQARLASLREQQAGLEEQELGVMEEAESLQEELAALDARQADLEEEAGRLAARLAQEEARIDGLLDGVAAAREAGLPGVPPPVLSAYERLRGSARLKGLVAAALEGDVCSACHTSLPVTLARRIRDAEATAVLHCERCQRILVALS